MPRPTILLFLSAIALFGCGGAPDVSLLDDASSGSDAGSGGDVGSPDVADASCDVAQCAVIPAGFTAVRLSDASTACPSGWSSADRVSNPVAAADACTCACNVTQDPDCSTGNIARSLDDTTSATCGTPATTFVASGDGCTSINASLYLNHAHYEVTAPPPTGGQCSYDAVLDAKKVTGTPARLCAPPASCVGAICDGPICVEQDGDVDCPAAFPTKTLVGQTATATCGACGTSGCVATGTCTGTLSFFTDSQCSMGEVDFTADGTCKANPASTTTAYSYYSYKGSLSSSTCMGTPPTSQAQASLSGAATVCCKN